MTKIEKIKKKWPEIIKEVGPAFLLFVANFVVIGWAVAFFEGMSFKDGFFDGPWWGIVSATTVGYGDISPGSVFARWLAVWLLLSSIVLLSYIQAKLTKVMIEEPNVYTHEEQERDEALAAWDHSLIIAIAQKLGIDYLSMEEYDRYENALIAVDNQEKENNS